MDHIQPQAPDKGQDQHRSQHTSTNFEDADGCGAAPLSPHLMSTVDNLVISPASSSIGSPSRDFADDAPANPFRLDFDEDRDERSTPLYKDAVLNGDDDDNHSTHSNNLSRVSLSSSRSNDGSNTMDYSEVGPEQNDFDLAPVNLNRIPSLSLSNHSGYDTDEDEDGVLRRFHDQAKSALRLSMSVSLRSDDDDESVYSAVNTSADVDDENQRRNDADALTGRCSRNQGEKNNRARKKKKSATDRIRDAIHGMRKAHQDAQLQRSTRRFLAMSEGNRTAQSFTEALCLSPWCDFSYGRGMALMMGVLFILVAVAIALSKLGHSAGGIWTCTLGITVVLVRRFWVPLYWLVWGQFVEKRRRRNIQMYDTLNGERPSGLQMSVQNFERVQDYDDGAIEFTDAAVESRNPEVNDSTSGVLA
eukprot:CCRYP_006967-RA/>CCRYP_006967-RA protein AED:0.38 eAED:0.38 QI:0/-1/0/1/-1/1/1/0/417